MHNLCTIVYFFNEVLFCLPRKPYRHGQPFFPSIVAKKSIQECARISACFPEKYRTHSVCRINRNTWATKVINHSIHFIMSDLQHRQAGQSSEKTRPKNRKQAGKGSSQRKRLRWILIILALLFFYGLMRDTINPFGNQEFIEIPHGDHSHFVPRDRNPDISISDFPTSPPGPNERITPDGRVVPK